VPSPLPNKSQSLAQSNYKQNGFNSVVLFSKYSSTQNSNPERRAVHIRTVSGISNVSIGGSNRVSGHSYVSGFSVLCCDEIHRDILILHPTSLAEKLEVNSLYKIVSYKANGLLA
jgi:hypothetical protein